MLRYDRQTKPGLVALYNIRPGNRAGPFLQPWSLHRASWPPWNTLLPTFQFSSVTPGLTWCWAQALRDHDTVINDIDEVVAGTEMFSGVAGMRKEMAWRWHWAVTRFILELLRPEMHSCHVKTSEWKESRHWYWRPNAVSGEIESRTQACKPQRNI